MSLSALKSSPRVTANDIDTRGWRRGQDTIKRDPPKMFMTTRREKVGDSQAFAQSVVSNANRLDEYINVYAKGINHFVDVSYDNSSNNGGGQYSGSASLPYKIMRGGAFRPPILRQEDKLPLSRLPRKTTSMTVNKGDVNHVLKLLDRDDSNSIKKTLTVTSVVSSKTYDLRKMQRPENTSSMLKDAIHTEKYTTPLMNKETISNKTVVLPDTLKVYTHITPKASKNTLTADNELVLNRKAPVSVASLNKASNLTKVMHPEKFINLQARNPETVVTTIAPVKKNTEHLNVKYHRLKEKAAREELTVKGYIPRVAR